jgi:glycosyltransferase involved in cell wall biosynthesis
MFILITGTIEPRKNLTRAIKAWSMLPDELKSNYPLVIAGTDGWKNQEIEDTIKENSSIHITEYVDDRTLANLYSGASLFLYPSLYEGFGLPPLEAMACGTPVLASNSSCIPEICGSGAVFFNPFDEEELASLMEELLSKPEKSKKLSEWYRKSLSYFLGSSRKRYTSIFCTNHCKALYPETKMINQFLRELRFFLISAA